MLDPRMAELSPRGQEPVETRMGMQYGVNQADECWDFARGPAYATHQARLREIDTRLVRLFLFDKRAPSPLTEWSVFASYVEAVLSIGATPMITFGKLHRPFDDPRAVRWFANQCADVVWSCIERWGGEVVRDWYWCILNEPNNAWISGGITFEQYRRLYEAIARESTRWLAPYLNGRKPLIGGPAIEGFEPFWWDWAWRFVNEIDNSLIGFLDWHLYGDWREHGEQSAPLDPATHRALMMSVTPEYEARARAIGRLLQGRNIRNICGELNCHSHYTTEVRQRFNYSVFGAAFYTSALLSLMRGGADAEMFWTGTEENGGYGMMNKHGEPRPAFYAKRLCTQHIRYGDWVSFPRWAHDPEALDIVIARGDDGRRSALFVHRRAEPASYSVAELSGAGGEAACYQRLLKIDEGTGNRVAERPFDRVIRFDGFGVAVVTNAAPEGEAEDWPGSDQTVADG